MQLTAKQLEVQKWADKTLSLGCIFTDKYHRDNSDSLVYNIIFALGKPYEGLQLVYYAPDFYAVRLFDLRLDFLLCEREKYRTTNKNIGELRYEIIGHPMTRGRLCYLINTNKYNTATEEMMLYTDNNYEIFQKTVLERPEEFIDLVIAFLSTLPKE